MNIGSRIKSLRKTEKLTQKEFSKRLCISQSYLSGLENGSEEPTNKLLKLIELEFNVSSDWLYNGIGEMYSMYVDNDRGYLSEFSNKALLDILIELNTDSNAKYNHVTSVLTSVAGLLKAETKLSEDKRISYLENLGELCINIDRLKDITMINKTKDDTTIKKHIKIICDSLYNIIELLSK